MKRYDNEANIYFNIQEFLMGHWYHTSKFDCEESGNLK